MEALIEPDRTNAYLRGFILPEELHMHLQALYPGQIRGSVFGETTRYGATLRVGGQTWTFNLIGQEGSRELTFWTREDSGEIPEQVRKLAFHEAADRILCVRRGHSKAVERKRRSKSLKA